MDGLRDDPMPYGVDTIRLPISFPAAPASRGYDGRMWRMRPLRGWTGGQAASGEPAVGAEQGGSTVQGVASGSAGAAQQANAGSSLRATLDRVIDAMPAKASAAEAQGGGQVVKAASEVPAGLAPSAGAASDGGGLTAQRPDEAPPAAAQAGPSPQPSPAAEEHGRLWWWLHDHGLAKTRHEQADDLRKAWGASSGLLVTDKDGVPVNVEQLSDDEVIALNKDLRGWQGRPQIAAAAAATPIRTSWGWHGSKPYKDALDQLRYPGTYNTLNGKVPGRKEAERMIEESGGRVVRSEEGHPPGGVSKHHEPHINYEPKYGKKATVIVKEDE